MNSEQIKLTKRANDLTGKIVGQLTVNCVYGRDKHSHIIWDCQCSCGNSAKVKASELLRGTTKSCGCIINNTNPIVTHSSHKLKSDSKSWKGCGDISGYFWSKINDSAKRRDIKILVTIEEVWELFLKQNKKCALSGMPIKFADSYKDQRKHNGTTASLDRIDSKLGYELSNLQWVHKDINFMKQSYTQEYFVELCKHVYLNNKDKI